MSPLSGKNYMDRIELMFLLELLGFSGYRAPLSKIKLNGKVLAKKREEICRTLCDRGFLVCSYKVSKFKIAPPGKFLLKQDVDHLPLTKQELNVLQASAKDTITPKEIDIPSEERQTVIQGLANRGLIQVKDQKIKDVWLTERGKEYLQYEYSFSDAHLVISSELLNNYIQFLRELFQEVLPPPYKAMQTISDEKILQTIVELERQLNTDNHMPIFHLREKLHPLLSKEELDDRLYRLQQLGMIELGGLSAANAFVFSSEQIEAGVAQELGTPLFFVTLK